MVIVLVCQCIFFLDCLALFGVFFFKELSTFFFFDQVSGFSGFLSVPGLPETNLSEARLLAF